MIDDDPDDRRPMRGALHLTPEQMRAIYQRISEQTERSFRELAATRLIALDHSHLLDTPPDGFTLHATTRRGDESAQGPTRTSSA